MACTTLPGARSEASARVHGHTYQGEVAVAGEPDASGMVVDLGHLRATLTRRDDGVLETRSFGKQDSSQMKIFARSDCLIVRPPNAPALEAGERCTILVLRDH